MRVLLRYRRDFQPKNKDWLHCGFSKEIITRVIETEKDLRKAQDTIDNSCSREDTLTEKFSLLTEEISAVLFERDNLQVCLY